MAVQSKKSCQWSYNQIKEELDIRYSGLIDEDELERQIREARQTPEMTYSKFYDHIYALALRLNKSEIETEDITLRAFKVHQLIQLVH